MKGWVTKPMGQLCSIKNGKSNSEDAIEGAPYAFFDRSKKIKQSTKYLFDCEALIIPGEGAEFLPRQYSGKFDLHQRAYALYDFTEEIDSKYLYYYLIHEKDYFPRVAVGATVKSLRLRHFEDLPVLHPAFPEQQRIVGKLDAAFAALTEAQAHVERNRANARELFESYLNGVFEGKGDGWVEKPISECFKIRSGDFMPAKSMNESGPYEVYGGNGVAGMHDAFNLSGSNVVIGRVGAKCGNVRHIETPIWLTDNAFCISEYLVAFDHEFLTYLLNHLDLRSYARQAAQPVVSYSSLKDVVLRFPSSVADQRKFAKRMAELEVETGKLETTYQQKLSELAGLRKAVLGAAFSGQL